MIFFRALHTRNKFTRNNYHFNANEKHEIHVSSESVLTIILVVSLSV